jgi:hypothetical protein
MLINWEFSPQLIKSFFFGFEITLLNTRFAMSLFFYIDFFVIFSTNTSVTHFFFHMLLRNCHISVKSSHICIFKVSYWRALK